MTQASDDAQARIFNGLALAKAGRNLEAIEQFRRAAELRPDSAAPYYNLAVVLRNLRRLDEAIACYRKVISLKPQAFEPYVNLAEALKDQGRVEEAVDALRRAIEIKPDISRHWSSMLILLHTHPGYDAEMILNEHRRWEQNCAAELVRDSRPFENDFSANRRLRIGYLADFKDHPAAYALEPILASHNRAQFEIVCYANAAVEDDVTRRFQSLADVWRPIATLSNTQVAQMIRDDRIDILVDAIGHSLSGTRMPLLAAKPAPILVNYGSYPATIGLSAIDWRITDVHLDPPGETEQFNAEKLARISSFWCYPTGEVGKGVCDPPAKRKGFVTFGAMTNPGKAHGGVIELWSKVLASVPASKLRMLVLEAGDTSEYFAQQFERFGVARNRIEMIGMRPRDEYLRGYGEIDIALDTFPYNGHMTTCDALWMGVPVVTLAGETSVGRAGVSLLSNVGLSDLVAHSPQEYIDIATSLAGDIDKLAALRRNLRNRMKASPICDARMLIAQIEQHYRAMWENFISLRT